MMSPVTAGVVDVAPNAGFHANGPAHWPARPPHCRPRRDGLRGGTVLEAGFTLIGWSASSVGATGLPAGLIMPTRRCPRTRPTHRRRCGRRRPRPVRRMRRVRSAPGHRRPGRRAGRPAGSGARVAGGLADGGAQQGDGRRDGVGTGWVTEGLFFLEEHATGMGTGGPTGTGGCQPGNTGGGQGVAFSVPRRRQLRTAAPETLACSLLGRPNRERSLREAALETT